MGSKKKSRIVLVLGLIAFAEIVMSLIFACQEANAMQSKQRSKYFNNVGQLHYEYYPGLFLPLRDGRILALGGELSGDSAKDPLRHRAEDGKTYGYEQGMTELYDPVTTETKVLTRLPLTFKTLLSPVGRQMRAIELKDGRIFLVGKFLDLRSGLTSPKLLSNNFSECSKVNHKKKFDCIQSQERDLFGIIYDWRNNTYETVKSPQGIAPRCMSTMSLLPDGKVVIVGGAITDTMYDSWKYFPETRVLIFDPCTKSLNVVGELRHVRYGHEMIQIGENQFLLIGGWGPSIEESPEAAKSPDDFGNCFTHEVEVFDLKTGHSALVGHTLSERYDFSATQLPNGEIFVHGGITTPTSNCGGADASEIFNPKTGLSRYVGLAREPESYRLTEGSPYVLFGEGWCFQAGMNKSYIVLTGSMWGYIYNCKHLVGTQPLTESDVIRDYLRQPREGHSMVQTPDGRLFVLGGQVQSINQPGARLIEEFVYSNAFRKGK